MSNRMRRTSALIASGAAIVATAATVDAVVANTQTDPPLKANQSQSDVAPGCGTRPTDLGDFRYTIEGKTYRLAENGDRGLGEHEVQGYTEEDYAKQHFFVRDGQQVAMGEKPVVLNGNGNYDPINGIARFHRSVGDPDLHDVFDISEPPIGKVEANIALGCLDFGADGKAEVLLGSSDKFRVVVEIAREPLTGGKETLASVRAQLDELTANRAATGSNNQFDATADLLRGIYPKLMDSPASASGYKASVLLYNGLAPEYGLPTIVLDPVAGTGGHEIAASLVLDAQIILDRLEGPSDPDGIIQPYPYETTDERKADVNEVYQLLTGTPATAPDYRVMVKRYNEHAPFYDLPTIPLA